MTELVLKTGRRAIAWTGINWPTNGWRLLILAALFALASAGPELRGIVFTAISDAYLQVTVFVAATLALVYVFESAFSFDLGQTMARARYLQAPMAAFLGALPGCGGAIIVVTQYTRGLLSFGSVVAVLIATMGDAAFLLIAREPTIGLAIMALGFTFGTLSAWVVDAIHGTQFMRPALEKVSDPIRARSRIRDPVELPLATRIANNAWIYLVVPGAVLGLFIAVQFDIDQFFGAWAALEPTHWFGVAAGLLCLAMWGLAKRSKISHLGQGQGADDAQTLTTSQRVIKDTNFVTSWVVLGFLTYELGVYWAGTGIENWLQVWAPFVPFVAILVGFIPGCGPQIVVTTLYLTGAIPLSAQLGNAISNDGDALFPALAMAPRAAVLATLYSAIPALIVAYGYFLLFE
jgi:hypothetical protein